MQKTIKLIAAFILLSAASANAQYKISIPAFTAYAVPAEENNGDDESKLFTEKEGLHNWTDKNQQIQFYFNIRNKGNLNIYLSAKNNSGSSKLTATIAGKIFNIIIPQSAKFIKIAVGNIEITEPGFYNINFSCTAKKGDRVADIKALELSGTAVKNIHFNSKPRRNAASVHLMYPLADSMKALSFYNEVTIPKDADVVHSYYMACGFARGYFGIQVNSPTERRVIFSVWDAGNEAVDRNKVTHENKVQLIAKGEDVFADGFGNEGTGGHSHWIYNWKAGETYKFFTTATTDSASNTTTYTGYFFIPEIQKWKLIACFKAPKDGKPLRNLYSFSENFVGNNGQLLRKAYFGNQWIRRENGEWKELTESKFSYDATGKAGDRIDYGGGTEDNKFYLWHGGFKQATAKFGEVFTRKANNEKPVIDLYKNADSAIELKKERKAIKAFLLKTEPAGDTSWKEKSEVHYKILTEGTGDFVTLNDTLVVNYKGQLLNGFIFDQTKEKPATFPLKRLIKGWQIGLPFCRQGGKIRLLIPSPLAYSIRNLGIISPNNVLIFDVEVLEIKKGN